MDFNILLNKLAKSFPKRYAKMNHDFVGKMCGQKPKTVKKVFICLDCDFEVFPEIKKYKPDVVFTHHPLIYGTRAKVFKFHPEKKELVNELENLQIPVYSYHTNFDMGRGGMNDTLAQLLNLENVYTPLEDKFMRIGELNKALDINDFAKYAKEKLDVDYSLLINAGNRKIKKVGIVGGAGSGTWPIAKKEGCDIYISGDAPHHVRREIVNAKFNYLDMPHEIEKAFINRFKEILLSIDNSLEIKCVDHEKLPKVI